MVTFTVWVPVEGVSQDATPEQLNSAATRVKLAIERTGVAMVDIDNIEAWDMEG